MQSLKKMTIIYKLLYTDFYLYVIGRLDTNVIYESIKVTLYTENSYIMGKKLHMDYSYIISVGNIDECWRELCQG